MTDWYVGQKVVCVDASLETAHRMHPLANYIGDLDGLTEGTVYTIRSVALSWHGIGLRLVGIIRPPDHEGQESTYSEVRFRPLVEQKLKDILSVPADPDSEQWDNRRKVSEPAGGPPHAWGTWMAPTVQNVSVSFPGLFRAIWTKLD